MYKLIDIFFCNYFIFALAIEFQYIHETKSYKSEGKVFNKFIIVLNRFFKKVFDEGK
jgi:hypothetical protein